MRKQYYTEVEFVNMKKLFPEDKGAKRGIRDFLDKKGFYIVLLLCIAVVAGTAVYVTSRNATLNKPDYDAQNFIPDENATNSDAIAGGMNVQEQTGTTASVNTQDKAVGDTAKASTKTDENKTPVPQKGAEPKITTPKTPAAPAKTTPPKTSSTKSTVSAKQQNFVMPVSGEVTFEYAKDKLVYSKTLEEWRTHEGLDLASDRGTPVKAAADGVVTDIKNDPRFGIIVVIDHKNGLESVYSNLASEDMVTVNENIKQGQIIGSVGNSAAFESAEQSHLHFEVLKDNVSVDPASYLPKSTAAKN